MKREIFDKLHHEYSNKITKMWESEVISTHPSEIPEKSMAFLTALENVKLSTTESLTSFGVSKQIEKTLEEYTKAKKAEIKANRGKIKKTVQTTKFIKKEEDKMFR